jgi:hemerythrin
MNVRLSIFKKGLKKKMSTLIEEFKREHSKIIETLKEVKELDIHTKKGKARLMSVKASLLEHLKEEDEKFYPVLRKEAEQNKELKEELEIFAKDWGNVSSVAFEIFDKYDKGVLEEEGSWDFETLFTTLRHRMKNEEDFLYGEYDKIDR